MFKIGLIGYTNAGKSTIMNVLTNDKQYEADELFATLDATTKQIYLQNQFQVTLTDTVGFIQNLPTELVAAFKSTLKKVVTLTFCCTLLMPAIQIMRSMKSGFEFVKRARHARYSAPSCL